MDRTGDRRTDPRNHSQATLLGKADVSAAEGEVLALSRNQYLLDGLCDSSLFPESFGFVRLLVLVVLSRLGVSKSLASFLEK